jgi:hypothetical protein
VQKSLLVAVALFVSSGLAHAQDGERCKVTDPTGTPLNVRAQPNGKIIGTLANGTLVAILEYAPDDNGKPWAKVAHHETKRPIGWVFREFVSCF